MSNSKRKIIEFTNIIIEDSVNPRENLDWSAIQDYSACISELPPMGVCKVDGVGHILTRGFHRIEAHKMAGMEVAEFIVQQGTMEEARRDAYLNNLPNGVRLSNSERQRVYEFEIASNPYRSDIDIAVICKTSAKKIRTVRRFLEAEGKIPEIQPNLIPIAGGNGSERTYVVDPRRIERPWFQRRRKTTLSERMLPCRTRACGWPISQRAHLLDVEAWGENPHTRQMCSNCHELYDILVADLEEKGPRSKVLKSKYILELGKGHKAIVELSEIAEDMVHTRATLRKNYEEGVKHRELAH